MNVGKRIRLMTDAHSRSVHNICQNEVWDNLITIYIPISSCQEGCNHIYLTLFHAKFCLSQQQLVSVFHQLENNKWHMTLSGSMFVLEITVGWVILHAFHCLKIFFNYLLHKDCSGIPSECQLVATNGDRVKHYIPADHLI